MHRTTCAQSGKWKNAAQPLLGATTGLGGDGLWNASVGAAGKAFVENDNADAAWMWFWRKVQNRNKKERSLSQTLDILRSAHYIIRGTYIARFTLFRLSWNTRAWGNPGYWPFLEICRVLSPKTSDSYPFASGKTRGLWIDFDLITGIHLCLDTYNTWSNLNLKFMSFPGKTWFGGMFLSVLRLWVTLEEGCNK